MRCGKCIMLKSIAVIGAATNPALVHLEKLLDSVRQLSQHAQQGTHVLFVPRMTEPLAQQLHQVGISLQDRLGNGCCCQVLRVCGRNVSKLPSAAYEATVGWYQKPHHRGTQAKVSLFSHAAAKATG